MPVSQIGPDLIKRTHDIDADADLVVQYLKDIRSLLLETRPKTDEDHTYAISSTMPYIVDYKERKKVYLLSAVTLTLLIEDAGTYTVPANTWVDISFQAGTRIVATGQTAQVQVLIRCSDIPIPVPFSITVNSSGTANVNLISVSGATLTLGQKTMANSIPVTVASDQTIILGTGGNAIGYVGQQFANPAGVEEIVHDNWDNITGQTLTAVGPGTYTAPQTNPNAIGLMLAINITAISGAGTLTVSIQNVDPVSGATFNLITSATLSAVGKTVMMVYPSIPVAANSTQNGALTRSWQISSVEAGVGTTVTAAISVSYII